MDAAAAQSLVVAVIVAAAALFVGVRLARTLAAARRRPKEGCGGGCGCSTEH
jgi:ABC-type spermidine/putrescine transport system permease subunit II